MKKYSKWKDEKIKELFSFIENGKKQNENLTKLFDAFAKKTGRMPNSVRNYYYMELDNLLSNPKRAQKLNIKLEMHQKINPKEFTFEESKELVKNILKLTAQGMSVRKACLVLAKDNINEMVRYQNKYRTIMLKDKKLFDECISELKSSGIEIKSNKQLPNNVIQFRERKNILSDSDINSLFIGLVKLVKKQAGEEADKALKIQNEKANNLLRKALVELTEKENEIKDLRKNFKVMADNNQKLTEELKTVRGKNAELLAKFGKHEKFKQEM